MAKVGKYELVRKLATGGMAEVFLAKAEWAMGVERIVVVKRILAHLVEDPSFTEMFLTEAKLASQLSHPNIVQIFEFGESEGTYYLAMEYVDGPNLRALATCAAEAGKPIPFRICAKIISSACEALAYAHELTDAVTGEPLQLVHRDISPDNILISRNGAVKVVDFGIAKAVTQSHHTKTGLVKGKVAYMAPEQLKSKSVDRRADVYALGVVLYELVSGAKPYDAESEITMIHAVLYESAVPIRERRSDVPEELERIIAKALAHERAERYADCREMYTDLERYVMTASREPIGAFQIAQLIADLKAAPLGPQGTPPPGLATPNRAAPVVKTPQPSRKDEAPPAREQAVETDEEVRTLMDGSESGLTMRVLANALLPDVGPDDATRPQKALDFQERHDRIRIERPPERKSGLHPIPVPVAEADTIAKAPSRSQPAPARAPQPISRPPTRSQGARRAPPADREASNGGGSRVAVIAIAGALLFAGSALLGWMFWPQRSPPPQVQTGGTTLQTGEKTGTETAVAATAEDAGLPQPDENPPTSDRPVEMVVQPTVEPTVEPPPGEILLIVRSEPPAFIRLLQGKKSRAFGRSPQTAKLLPGAVEIVVSDEGEGIAKTERIVLKAGSGAVKHTVEIGKSTLVFNSVPWANVTVDGKALGETPVKREVHEGVHAVVFDCSNGKKDTQEVASKAGEEVKVKSKCQ